MDQNNQPNQGVMPPQQPNPPMQQNEQQNSNPYSEVPQQVAQPAYQQENPQPQQPDGSYVLATFWQRWAATFVDGIILGVFGFFLGMLLVALDLKNQANIFSTLIGIVYSVYFIAAQGATPGKKALKLRVQNKDTAQNLSYVEAFLREVPGKFVSGIALGLGYLWMIWDDKKQTWHDKIANSVVVKMQ